jgi:hypothetical protein
MSSQVKVTLRVTVSQPVGLGVEPHLGLMTRYLLLFDSYGLVFWGALSLTRGRVCLLYMLLALVSAVFLGSESLVTREKNLLSQIWDFPFRFLLRLAGGGIRPRLHTGVWPMKCPQPWNRLLAHWVGDTLSKGNFSSVIHVVVPGIYFLTFVAAGRRVLATRCLSNAHIFFCCHSVLESVGLIVA